MANLIHHGNCATIGLILASGWGCPHEVNGRCDRRNAPCDPLVQGCVLLEREKNRQKENEEKNKRGGGQKGGG